MTYNVRACVGTDGRLDPERIARVIAAEAPDVVAMQELDVGRRRSGQSDQPHLIAQDLNMHFHFHPAFEVEEERYGNAILSRYHVNIVHQGELPSLPQLKSEKRGALWIQIDVNGRSVQVINTHLGLNEPERHVQTAALLGEDWLKNSRCVSPRILCGDFNTRPRSAICRQFCGEHHSADFRLTEASHGATWPTLFPVFRLDHVFVSPDFKITSVYIPKTALTRRASDHYPVVVDLEL